MNEIKAAKAPAAIGIYSQAIQTGEWVFLSGQIPLQPDTMEIVSGSINEQLMQVFENLRAVCEAAGGTLADVVKLTIYLTDLANFSYVNEIMAHYFVAPYPARAAIEVKGLPRGAQVEVDGIMRLPT